MILLDPCLLQALRFKLKISLGLNKLIANMQNTTSPYPFQNLPGNINLSSAAVQDLFRLRTISYFPSSWRELLAATFQVRD
jgi:hypothetical protein